MFSWAVAVMHSREPPPPASPSSTTTGDALCKVAFIDCAGVGRPATPSTSCRSMASSDSVTSSMTSSSRDSSSGDDGEEPSGATSSSWSTYVYFYPRHDMTFTHCLLTASPRIDCDQVARSSAAPWPRSARPRRRPESVAAGPAAGRWRRRVNAARTPFWFPASRTDDTPTYFCYPRHDLSYAEVDASRLDRQPAGHAAAAPPFNAILEEPPTDDDDFAAALDDRKTVDAVRLLPVR